MKSTIDTASRGKGRFGDQRKMNGSVIVEGVVGVNLILAVLVISVIVLFNVLAIITYKQKVSMVANAAAAKAAKLSPGAFHSRLSRKTVIEQEKEISNFVDEGLKAFNLPPAKKFRMTVDGNRAYASAHGNATGIRNVTISFSVDHLPLLGFLPGIIPADISLKEASSAILPSRQMAGLYTFEAWSNEGSGALVNIMTMPSYGRFKKGVSDQVEPADALSTQAAFRKFEHTAKTSSFTKLRLANIPNPPAEVFLPASPATWDRFKQ